MRRVAVDADRAYGKPALNDPFAVDGERVFLPHAGLFFPSAQLRPRACGTFRRVAAN